MNSKQEGPVIAVFGPGAGAGPNGPPHPTCYYNADVNEQEIQCQGGKKAFKYFQEFDIVVNY